MKTILFQGDSITDCSRIRKLPEGKVTGKLAKVFYSLKKASEMGNGYPALVADALGDKGEYKFYNRGVSGDRIPDVYARIVRDIIKLEPDYMSLLVGVNDVWHGFDFNNGTGMERFEKVYSIFLEEIKKELPDTKVMIMEPFILRGSATDNREGEPDRYKNFRSSIEEIAAITEGLAEKYGYKFIRLQKILDEAAAKSSPEKILGDGVHPTEKGHEIIKNEWLKAFEEIK